MKHKIADSESFLNDTTATVVRYLRTIFEPKKLDLNESEMEQNPEDSVRFDSFGIEHASFLFKRKNDVNLTNNNIIKGSKHGRKRTKRESVHD